MCKKGTRKDDNQEKKDIKERIGISRSEKREKITKKKRKSKPNELKYVNKREIKEKDRTEI